MHFHSHFGPGCAIIGMIHVAALPGTPRHSLTPEAILAQAVREAEIYARAGIDALMIENMHDRPYLKGTVGPEVTAWMTRLGHAVKQASGLPTGLQILAGANREALAAAQAAGLDFIRAEGFVFAHVADEGLIEASAGDLLRYRKQIGAENILIFTDIKKKHSSHALTTDVDLVETAHAAEFFLSDAVIVTGTATGRAASLEEVAAVKKSVSLPVLVGSGITLDNLEAFMQVADGLIVGSWFKKGGKWENEVDEERVRRMMERKRKVGGRK